MKALQFSLQNANMALASNWLKLTEAAQSGLCSEAHRRWRSKCAEPCNRPIPPQTELPCSASMQGRTPGPVMEICGWKRYGKAASLTSSAEFMTDSLLVQKNVKITALGDRPSGDSVILWTCKGRHCKSVQVWSYRLAQGCHRDQRRCQQEENLNCTRTHQIKPTSWSNDKPHTEFKDTSSFLNDPSSGVKFSAKAHGLILPKGGNWEGRKRWPAAGPTLISPTCLGSHSESQIWV